jgi:hypothetical protein
MSDNTCPHDKFTTPDRKHMECTGCGRLFSADLYWGVYDQLEYGKDQGCGEEAIEVIQMVEDHHKEREERESAAVRAINALLEDHYMITTSWGEEQCATCIENGGAIGAIETQWPCDIYATIQDAIGDE